MKTIILSVGHNLGLATAKSTVRDRGAAANDTTEYDEVNKIIDVVMAANVPGLRLLKVPGQLNLTQRIKWVNDIARKEIVDYCIEFHMDAGSVTAEGAMCYYYGTNKESKEAAARLIGDYTKYSAIQNDGVRSDEVSRFGSLGWIRQTKPLALLLEMGFITNINDIAKVREKGVISILRAMYGLCEMELPPHLVKKEQPVTTPTICKCCGQSLPSKQ